ncbi:hypothetical protein G6O69_29595 [Pseudenhygromyxa sp. WMMC2535]|uniref:hypothetical protein n=1 Tax=Pseudenhygromyxa sp. WMMC2535 TaxID=2712867 RepID=UPI001557CD21|nr:hypothetical protein [Pseudenhygromyxa sp. WMMC2535]NVB42017.1 hypothetical protein [Pseudenhygromyxa sp. WMMC2535]
MWPNEREALSVWADRQLSAGAPLGEIVALHLRARERSADTTRTDAAIHEEVFALRARAERLRLEHAEALLGPDLGELPERLRLRWSMGLVRSVYVDARPRDYERPRPLLVLDLLTQLLRQPALRFVDELHVDTPEYDDALERGLLAALGEASCPSRPRRLILGAMPRRFRVIQSLAASPGRARYGPLQRDQLEAPAAAGLTWLIRWGQIQALPWASGDAGSRLQALERALAGPWSPAHERQLGRAMWDTSVRLRQRLFQALPTLPDDAAPLLLPALAIALDAQPPLAAVLERSLTRVSARPSWVAGVADNFGVHEPWVPRWLTGVSRVSRQAAARACPRLRAMLTRRIPPHHERNLRRDLGALERWSTQALEAAPFEDESVAELIAKIGDGPRGFGRKRGGPPPS